MKIFNILILLFIVLFYWIYYYFYIFVKFYFLDVDECEEAASSTTSSSLLDICPQANSVCKNAIGGFVCECKSVLSMIFCPNLI